jgi:glycolate dehydrogenase FAD-linked subunit
VDKEELVRKLDEIVGKENVLSSDVDRESYSRDMGEFEGTPGVVARPGSEQEVERIVALADQHTIPILARGAGSSLTGAAVLKGAIMVDMRRMANVIHVDTINWHVRVQPGIALDDLNIELKKYGFFFPPDPASSYICTVGGAIAEGSGGLRCVKYGTMKDWVLSMRVVLPSGRVTTMGEPLAKNRAGYDLLHLMVGSEGTLGIITEAYLKIIPLPQNPDKRLLATFDSWDAVGNVIFDFKKAGIVPGLFEFIDKDHIRALNEKLGQNLEEAEATLIIDVEEAILTRTTDILRARGSTEVRVAKDQEEADTLYEVRANGLLAVKSLAPASMVEDVSVPLDRLGEFLRKVKLIASGNKLMIPVMGHAGDGNVHPIILYDNSDKDSSAAAAKAFEDVCRAAIELGGSISGEHGIGTQKVGLLREQLRSHDAEESLRLMKEIKRLFDPKGIMNPGKYVEAA